MTDVYAYNLGRVVMSKKSSITHYAQLDSSTRTICGRTARSLIPVDNLDPRETCDHCLRAKYEAQRGDVGNRVRESTLRVAQRTIDNRGWRR